MWVWTRYGRTIRLGLAWTFFKGDGISTKYTGFRRDELAEVFFAPQMDSNKPVCDLWGHQWSASFFNTADYPLASGKMDYFSSKPYPEGVGRALISHSSLEGGPEQYSWMAAAVTGNDEYLQLCEMSEEDTLAERAMREGEEPLRTWVTGRQGVVPERLGRVGVAPLSRLFYDLIESYTTFAPHNGVYVTHCAVRADV